MQRANSIYYNILQMQRIKRVMHTINTLQYMYTHLQYSIAPGRTPHLLLRAPVVGVAPGYVLVGGRERA